MAVGDRIRIISEEEYRIMSPPRRPRGEKPQTTIRYLNRQIALMQQTIGGIRMAMGDKDKVIAGFDVQMSEQEDQIQHLQRRNADQAAQLGWAKDEIRRASQRLAYLEGYFYAKEKETPHNQTFPPVRTPGALVAGDPPQTFAGTGSRDQEGVQIRGQDPEGSRSQQGAAGIGPAPGDKIRRFASNDLSHQKRRAVEHAEIADPYGGEYWTKSI